MNRNLPIAPSRHCGRRIPAHFAGKPKMQRRQATMVAGKGRAQVASDDDYRSFEPNSLKL
jgi:hypothetical protein